MYNAMNIALPTNHPLQCANDSHTLENMYHANKRKEKRKILYHSGFQLVKKNSTLLSLPYKKTASIKSSLHNTKLNGFTIFAVILTNKKF